MEELLYALELWGISIVAKTVNFIILLLLVRLILWLIGAIGVYKLSKIKEIKNPWLAFILPVYPFVLGKLSEKYEKKDGTKSAKYSFWLLLTYLFSLILYVAFFVTGASSLITITQFALNAIELDTAMTINMFSSAIYAICFYFIALVMSLVYIVLYYIALWRIYKLFDSKKATFYTILSVIFGFLAPIILYIIAQNVETEDEGYFQFSEE